MDLPKQLEIIDKMNVLLPSGISVNLPVCRPYFENWVGDLPKFDFGKKPLTKHNGQCIFAELAILRLFIDSGWEGVWVETYGGRHFIKDMPVGWKLSQHHVSIPENKESLLKSIWKIGKTTACFDVYVWKGDNIIFCEGKHKGKDKLTKAQTKFIEGALACGIKVDNLLIVEWEHCIDNNLN